MMRKRIGNSLGFTLIELMVVVGIIGILATIAIVQFRQFDSKVKQIEAKVNLEAIGKSVEAWQAEKDTYVATWADIEWAPTGTSRYSYKYNGVAHPSTPLVCETGAPASTATATSFVAVASGNIDIDATCDHWTYDQTRTFINTLSDLSG